MNHVHFATLTKAAIYRLCPPEHSNRFVFLYSLQAGLVIAPHSSIHWVSFYLLSESVPFSLVTVYHFCITIAKLGKGCH